MSNCGFIKSETVVLFVHKFKLTITARLSAKIVRNATLKIYSSAPHGLCSTHKQQVNADLFAFIKGEQAAGA